MPSLGLVHLSDMHLAGYADGALFDEDADIRRELEYDLAAVVEECGGVGAILLGGDTAGRGTGQEFDQATAWIDRLGERLGVPSDRVYCVPGNHDVDWSVIVKDAVLREIQGTLLDTPVDQINSRLRDFLESGPNRDVLLSALDAYNSFASQYGCDIQPDDHCWTQAVELDGITVKLVGLTSALLSGPGDAKKSDQSRLVLGPQATLGRFADTFTIVLCHHPLEWMRDGPAVQHFVDRAHLQLFGHEHLYRAARQGAGVRVYAGAVHPPRGGDEPWEPSYNVIRIETDPASPTDVKVSIWARRLGEDGRFGPAPETPQPEVFPIELTAPERVPDVVPAALPEPAEIQPAPTPTSEMERRAARKFAVLSTETQLLLGARLYLLDSTDAELEPRMRGRNVFHRARDAGRLDELEKEIDAHG